MLSGNRRYLSELYNFVCFAPHKSTTCLFKYPADSLSIYKSPLLKAASRHRMLTNKLDYKVQ